MFSQATLTKTWKAKCIQPLSKAALKTQEFNLDEGSENYNNLLACGLKDTKYLAEKYDDHATYHGYHVVSLTTKPIDFIFVNGYVKAVESSVIDSSFTDHILASDHFPITVKLTLFNGGTK